MRCSQLVTRLALVIGFALGLTFELGAVAAAQCPEKELHIHAAIQEAKRAGQLQQSSWLRYHMISSGYSSLAKAADESCDDASLMAKSTVTEALLGTYLAQEKVDAARRASAAACKSVYLAEARQGLVLSWVELARIRDQASRTQLFGQTMFAVRQAAAMLSMRLPPLGAGQSAIHSFAELYKAQTATALRAARNASCGDEAIGSIPGRS